MEDCSQWGRHSHSHLLGGKFKNAPCVVLPRALRDGTDGTHSSNRSVLRLLWLFLLPRFTLFSSPLRCHSITLLNRLRVHKPTLGICIWGGTQAQIKQNFQMTTASCSRSWDSVAPSFQPQDRLRSCLHAKASLLLESYMPGSKPNFCELCLLGGVKSVGDQEQTRPGRRRA